MDSIWFVVIGVVVAVLAVLGMYRIASWFMRLRTMSSAIVFVLGGSALFYALAVSLSAAFSRQQFVFDAEPSLLFIPAAFALSAAMQLQRGKP